MKHFALGLAGLLTAVGNADAGVSTERITTAGQIERGTEVTSAPGDHTRLFILERPGRVRVVNLKTNTLREEPFLAIEDRVSDVHDEFGLFGLAFHPAYRENGLFFVSYLNNDGDTTIRRYTVSDDPDRAHVQTGVDILTIDQTQLGHAATWIAFGPRDGYLYISVGDGVASCGAATHAQDVDDLRGKLLRIDVDGTGAPGGLYGIPADNPFADTPGADEVWALGLRNPWGCAFDRLTGDLYIADVGAAQTEELNIQPAASAGGENYGWNCREGTGCSPCGCDCGGGVTLTSPVYQYAHGPRCCVVGGIVYRGSRIPAEDGNYFFSDLCSNEIWSIRWDGGGFPNPIAREDELAPATGLLTTITNFGEDAWGAMYIVEDSGEVWRMYDPETPIQWADTNADGDVSFQDLLIVLNEWGPCVGCRGDVLGNDDVGLEDLLQVLVDWTLE
ncbi:MAG: PQQ-dependent sugar dehydrogenase [Phycisphaerae bacterium]|nr:PQQ-dependent sugar dehydrogenase [Phycisphaerae bacterium]